MRKSIILISFLWLTFGGIAHAKSHQAAPRYNRTSYSHSTKFRGGPLVGAGGGSASAKAGFFSEYKYAPDSSIQLGLLYFWSEYFLGSLNLPFGGSALIQAHYISIPILSRIYVIDPKTRHDFGLFLGFQLGYLLDATFKFKRESQLDADKLIWVLVDRFEKIDDTSIQEVAGQTEVQRFQVSFVAGYDYEFKNGCIIGLTYVNDLINVVKAKESRFDWTLQSRLGYNLAKLFV